MFRKIYKGSFFYFYTILSIIKLYYTIFSIIFYTILSIIFLFLTIISRVPSSLKFLSPYESVQLTVAFL